MLRLPGVEIRHLGAPPAELRRRELRIGAFVDHIVDFTAKGVQRGDRASALGRKKQEGVVEARPARRGLLLAILVGRHTALRSRSGQSKAPSTGRRRKMS